MKDIFSVDRIEGDIAVCISDNDVQVDVPLALLGGMKQNDIFSAEYDGSTLSSIVPMPEERDRRLASNRERLHRLFNRKKNS
jgi:hypothetical protein